MLMSFSFVLVSFGDDGSTAMIEEPVGEVISAALVAELIALVMSQSKGALSGLIKLTLTVTSPPIITAAMFPARVGYSIPVEATVKGPYSLLAVTSQAVRPLAKPVKQPLTAPARVCPVQVIASAVGKTAPPITSP